MKTKSKTTMKKETLQDGWKGIIHGFVGNMLAQLGDNVSQKMHVWFDQVKRKVAGGVLLILGLTYFLTGLSDYTNSIVGKDFPGLGYVIVGSIVVLIGYFMSKDDVNKKN